MLASPTRNTYEIGTGIYIYIYISVQRRKVRSSGILRPLLFCPFALALVFVLVSVSVFRFRFRLFFFRLRLCFRFRFCFLFRLLFLFSVSRPRVVFVFFVFADVFVHFFCLLLSVFTFCRVSVFFAYLFPFFRPLFREKRATGSSEKSRPSTPAERQGTLSKRPPPGWLTRWMERPTSSTVTRFSA